MYYNQYCKPVSSDLATNLYMDFEYKISPYIEFVQTHQSQYSLNAYRCAKYFIGLPCNKLRQLFYILTFNEIFVLLHQGKDDIALAIAKRMNFFDYIYWDNHELDLISRGLLLQ